MHGNLGKNYAPPLSPATKAYLDNFTRFVLEGKSTGDLDAQADAARDKAASLATVLDEAGVVPERGARKGPRYVITEAA